MMTEHEALQKALHALKEIDQLAEENLGDTVGEIRDITGTVIGDLARAGYTANDA